MKILRVVALVLCIPLVACASVTSQVDKSGPFLITALPQAIPSGFPFVSSSELLVLDTGPTASPRDPAAVLTLGSDYTVTGGNYNGSNQMQTGTVTIASGGTHAVLVGDYIVIKRNVPLNQTSSFTTTGPSTVLLLEQMGDKLATLSQQVNEVTARSLQFENFEFLSGTLSKSGRTGMLLGFDANGALAYTPSGTVPGTFVASIAGTSNEIAASSSTGVVTLSLPSSLTFTGKTITGGSYASASVSATVVNIPGVGDLSLAALTNASTTGVSVVRETNDQGANIIFGTAGSAVAGTVAGLNAAGLSYVITGANAATYPTAIAIATQSNAPIVFGVNNVEKGRFDASAFTTKVPVIINQATLTNPAPITGTQIHLTSPDNVSSFILGDAFGGAVSLFVGRRANGTSAAPTASVGGDALVVLGGLGYGATTYASADSGRVSVNATQTFTDTARGTSVVIETTPNGSVTRAVAVTVKGTGIVNLVNTPSYANNAAALSGGLVAGDLYRNGDVLQIVH